MVSPNFHSPIRFHADFLASSGSQELEQLFLQRQIQYRPGRKGAPGIHTFPEASTVYPHMWVCQGKGVAAPTVKYSLGSYWSGDQTPKQRRSEVRVAVTRYHSDLPYPDNVCPHLDLSTTSHMVTTPKSQPWSLTGNCKRAHCQGAWLAQLHSKEVKMDLGCHIQRKQGSYIK